MSDAKASNPGQLRLSASKMRILRPDLYGLRGIWRAVQGTMGKKLEDEIGCTTRLLMEGDSRAAVVVSLHPLLVAAYTDEMDCIAMLRFPASFISAYSLEVGSRLLTVNSYGYRPLTRDLIAGPRNTGHWGRFHPAIADFLSDELDRVQKRKSQIDEKEWERCAAMGHEYLRLKPKMARDGRPVLSCNPAEPYE